MMRASEPPMKERLLDESANLAFDEAMGHSCFWIWDAYSGINRNCL
jgi:DNA-binding XRE family transcriptional regulator